VGQPHCIECGARIQKLSNEEIINIIQDKVTHYSKTSQDKNKKVLGVEFSTDSVQILAPVVRGRKGEYYQLLYDMLGKGYTEAIVDGEKHNLREKIILEKNKKHEISVLVDSIGVDEIVKKTKDAKLRLSEAIEHAIHETSGLVEFNLRGESVVLSSQFACSNCGFSFPEVEPRLFSFNSPYGACPTCNGLGVKYLGALDLCEDCEGKRLRKEALSVYLISDGTRKNIVEITDLSIEEAKNFFDTLHLTDKEMEIAKVVLKEISARLVFLLDVGLNYLTLNRKADTLSGGEAQRIRLASQLGSQLVGALYVLDEPTIGLHQRDNEKLINTLLKLRDLGNTILVVEHDEDTAYASDFLVDIGPGAGVHGGNVVVADYLDKLLTAPTNKSNSITMSYLREEEKVYVPKERRNRSEGELTIKNGNIFNIKDLNTKIPLGKMVGITGVSGSGKSTLMYEIINRNLEAKLERKLRTAKTYNCEFFGGVEENLSRVILIDQSPIGRTPRSNPATYTGIWTPIRELFAETAEARVRGWSPSRFSFNVPGGRCEACQGNGEIAVEMHFLPTVYVQCDVCNGKRFMKETLDVKFKGKNVYEVLEMTIEEAEKFFYDIPSIHDRLDTLMQVGLSYIKLGQSATTLSGGEAQRVKISSELYRPHTERTIYLLDEPTVGLHFEDVRKLIDILNRLVDKGNSVMLIEHNLDVIKCCDWLIDIGPEGGVGGGKIVAQGTPEHVAGVEGSHTGRYLKKILKRDRQK
jgi:excinuclease ABC subunit A